MAGISEFVEGLRRIEGVGGYLLLRRDGHLLVHDVADPQGAASFCAMAGLGAAKIQEAFGFQRLRHIVLGGEKEPLFLLFPLGGHLLGIVPGPGAAVPQLSAAVLRFVRDFNARRRTGHPQGG